eukprot:GEMP01056292.1.p1 GENE.GEMP01056292.1~~GEMP01056292.1.p1  ORF type:complete len:203 (+),score=46.18 GEMP01056292.1:76-684(+)
MPTIGECLVYAQQKARFRPAPRVPAIDHKLRRNVIPLKDYNRAIQMCKPPPAPQSPHKQRRAPPTPELQRLFVISPRHARPVPSAYARRSRQQRAVFVTEAEHTAANSAAEIYFVHNGILKQLPSRRHALDTRQVPYATIDEASTLSREKAPTPCEGKPAGIVSDNAYRRPLRQQMYRTVSERRKRWGQSSDEVFACLGRCE